MELLNGVIMRSILLVWIVIQIGAGVLWYKQESYANKLVGQIVERDNAIKSAPTVAEIQHLGEMQRLDSEYLGRTQDRRAFLEPIALFATPVAILILLVTRFILTGRIRLILK